MLNYPNEFNDLHGSSMIRVEDHKTGYLIDPWRHLGPKRRKMLDESWAGLYREHILNHLPIEKLVPHFRSDFGRPTKELHTALSAVFLQQMFDLTDEETVRTLAFDASWHYALDIPGESDEDKYLSPKTLWTMRKLVTDEKLDGALFEDITSRLAKVFEVKTDLQRLDSVHVKSNMRRLGRLKLFQNVIRTFLTNLKRRQLTLFSELESGLTDRYLSERAPGCFSMVKPSEAQAKLAEAASDLGVLAERFRDRAETRKMSSFKMLLRVFYEQCVVREMPDGGKPVVEAIPSKEVSSDSLQNPSDPDATYSGHKGQGYSTQVMETYTETKDADEHAERLRLITHVEVTQACVGDANALMPALSSAADRSLTPTQLTADSLYGGDENCEAAAERGVEVVSPTMGHETGLGLSDFLMTETGEVTSCPAGHAPTKCLKGKGTFIVHFATALCLSCPRLSECPVKRGKNRYELHYNDKKMRTAKRRQRERGPAFREKYRWRAGVEATMSELDRKTGLKHLRVRGYPAVRLCAKLKATGVNVLRAARVYVMRLRKVRPNGPITSPYYDIWLLYWFMRGLLGSIWARKFHFHRRLVDFEVQPRAERGSGRNSCLAAA